MFSIVSKVNALSSLARPDLQHHVLGLVPFGEEPRGPGATVQGGGLCVSGQTGAHRGRPEQDALPEGRHKGDATVR